MDNVFLKNNLSKTQKLCFAGLLIAIITILQKVMAINYQFLPALPFVRISLGGCAMLMISSIILGPWYGLIIGIASDVLGYFIFDPKTMGFFPQITAIYAVLGFAAYWVFVAVRLIKNVKVTKVVELSIFAALFIFVTLYLALNNSIQMYGTIYNIALWQKIVIPIILLVLFCLLVLCIVLTNRFIKKRNTDGLLFNPYQISLACFILELGVMIIFGTLMKGFAFGFQTYLTILIVQIIIGFFNIPLNTFLVSYIMIIVKRIYKC